MRIVRAFATLTTRSIALVVVLIIRFVDAAPVFTVSPGSTAYISPSSSIDVVCTTRDPSTITWHNDDANKTLITTTFTITPISDRSSRLHLDDANSLTVAATQALRFCRATNSTGSVDSTSFSLTVGALPVIGTAPTDPTNEVEGTAVTLMCSFSAGLPNPEIFWKFTAKGTNKMVDVGTPTSGNQNNNLMLPNIQRNEAGTYTCYIRNPFGNVSASAALIVRYKPTVSIQFNPSPVKKGSSVTITCRSDSLPLATSHSLKRNGNFIPENSPTKSPSNTPSETIIEWSYTLIGSNETEGMYQCEANNTLGRGESQEKELVVLLPPDAPEVVQSAASDLCWSSGYLGHPPITNYSLSCTSKTDNLCSNEPAQFLATVNAANFTTVNNVSGILCANLTGPSADYTCSIGANNGAFDVKTSADTSTRPGKPGPVTIKNIADVTNTSFTVNWCVAFSGNDAALTSTINGVSADKATHSYDSQTQQGTTTVTQVDPGTSYTVAIKVSTSYGEALSEEKAQKTKCIPDVVNADGVKAVIKDGKMTVTFSDSRSGPCNTNNDFVIRNDDEILGTAKGEENQEGATEVVIDVDIVAEEGYQVTVAAKNGDFESPRSDPVTVEFVKEPTGGPVVKPTTEKPASSGGLSAGALAGIIVACVLIIIIIVVILVFCVYKQNHPPKDNNGHGTDGKFEKKESVEAPGPNSGSTYSPEKTHTKPVEMTYAELDLSTGGGGGGDKKEGTPVQSTPKPDAERVEYASIDREASRRKKMQKEAEEAERTSSPEKAAQPDETELSTMV